jgi:SAM-dependent methyltransferase
VNAAASSWLMLRVRSKRQGACDLDSLIPPTRHLPSYARTRNFRRAGQRFLQVAVKHGLQPDHSVLDLGCGVGRFAVALSRYLSHGGRYVGLDASKKAVVLCNQWIAPKLGEFTFLWADVPSNGAGQIYRFPFEDERFDFVFSNSLFTHLVPRLARNYIHEIGRVLRPGGCTVNTIFLLNRDSLSRVVDGASPHGQLHRFEGSALVKKAEKPEAWIAHDEDLVRQAHADGRLAIESIRYGAWSGRESTGPGFGAKDIVVASRLGDLQCPTGPDCHATVAL